jgi:hypothetical protein
MKRILWIVGFSIAALAFVLMVVVCVGALVLRRHLNVGGCEMLLVSAIGAWHMIGRIRVTIAQGDPTADFDRRDGLTNNDRDAKSAFDGFGS